MLFLVLSKKKLAVSGLAPVSAQNWAMGSDLTMLLFEDAVDSFCNLKEYQCSIQQHNKMIMIQSSGSCTRVGLTVGINSSCTVAVSIGSDASLVTV